MSARKRSASVADTELTLLDALNTPHGIIVKPSDPRAFTVRANRLIYEEGYPLVTKMVRGRPEEIWIVKRPNGATSDG